MENVKEELFIPKTKHKGLKIVLAILLIVIIGIGGYFIYKEKFNNPKNTVMNIIDNNIKNASNITSIENNKYKINGLVKVDATISDEFKDLSKIIRNIDLQFNGEVDLENKLSNIELNTKYKDEKLLNIKTIYKNNTLYLLLNDLYDKYIKVSFDNIQDKSNIDEINIDINDIKILYNSYYKALKEALDKLEFTSEDTKIMINDKEYNVKNNYTILNGNDTKKFIKDFINTLSIDNDLKNVLKKLKIEDTENLFKELINNLDKQELKNTIKINFYTKGILKQELISEKFEFINDNETIEFKLDNINNDEKMIAIKSKDIDINVKIKKTNSVLNFNLIANIMKTEIKFDLNANYEKIKSITDVDVSNNIGIDKLNENDQREIEEKIEKNNVLKSLIDDIRKINIVQE